LVAVEKSIVKVRLVGHCAGCPMSAMTLKNGVEALIKERVPEIQKVEAVK
jgi:Fe-S cluster biogenesis protein NfuA